MDAERDTEKTPCDDEGRDWGVQIQAEECPQLPENYQELEEARKGSSTAFRRSMVLLTP